MWINALKISFFVIFLHMEKEKKDMDTHYEELAKCILPKHMLDWFDLIKVETSQDSDKVISIFIWTRTR